MCKHPKLRFVLFVRSLLHHNAIVIFESQIAMRDRQAVTALFEKRIVHRIHATRALDFLDVSIAVVIEIVDVHGTAVRPAARRIRTVIHEIPVPEILENRLMVRLGIFHFVVDNAFLRPWSVQARRHGIIRRRGVTRSITEVIIATEIVHPRSFEKVLDFDIFRRACKLDHIILELHAAARTPRAPIHPDIVAIVENCGINVQFHVVRCIIGN